jgi:hypothetical protein
LDRAVAEAEAVVVEDEVDVEEDVEEASHR